MESEDLFASTEEVIDSTESLEKNDVNVSAADIEMLGDLSEDEEIAGDIVEGENELDQVENEDNQIDNENTSLQPADKETKSLAKDKTVQEAKLVQLPLARVKALMKLDPDLNLASAEAVFLATKATELFIESLARESFTFTVQAKKKTVQKKDVDMAISVVDSLMFLDGAMDF